jgi:hypothetical protein
MTLGPVNLSRSPIVGGLRLSPAGRDDDTATAPDPLAQVPMLIELNARYPGGLVAVTRVFYRLWGDYESQAGGNWPAEANAVSPGGQPVPSGLAVVAVGLYQCVLSRAAAADLVEQDRRSAQQAGKQPVIFRVWPDYPLYPHIDRSAPTVKADAAWRSYNAHGQGVVWAVIDSGIDGCHEHFSALELYQEARGVSLPDGLTSQLHQDFSYMVNPDDPGGPGGARRRPGAADGRRPGADRRVRARYPRRGHHRRLLATGQATARRGIGGPGRRVRAAGPCRRAERDGAGLRAGQHQGDAAQQLGPLDHFL